MNLNPVVKDCNGDIAKILGISTDPWFIEKVRDITGLYLNPLDRANVLSIDEKSKVQALDRTQPLLSLLTSKAEYSGLAEENPVKMPATA